MAKETGNWYALMEPMLHVVVARELMGSQEEKSLSDILGHYKLTVRERMTFVFCSCVVAQALLTKYQEEHPDASKIIDMSVDGIDENMEHLFTGSDLNSGKTPKGSDLLEKISGDCFFASIVRIIEQEKRFFQAISLSQDEIDLFMLSLSLAVADLQRDQKEVWEGIKFYKSIRDDVSEERATQVLKFCNELRAVLNLKPLE